MRSLLAHARSDLVGAALVLVCGAFLVVRSPTYGLHTGEVIGPGFMPFWFGVALLVFGVGTVVGALRRAQHAVADAEPAEAAGATVTDGDTEAPPDSPHRSQKVVVVFAATFVAAGLVPVLGAITAFALLIFGLLYGVERERWWLSGVVALGVMYVLYLLFLGFLRIPLPLGPWGF